MVFQSIFISMAAVIIGLSGSIHYDVATGPAIVISLGILFVFSQLIAPKI